MFFVSFHLKAVAGDDGLAVLGLVVKVFVAADAQETAGNVIYILKTAALQRHHSIVAALADLAVDVHRAVFGDLLQTAPQLGQGDIQRCFDVALGVGGRRADIDNAGPDSTRPRTWSTCT